MNVDSLLTGAPPMSLSSSGVASACKQAGAWIELSCFEEGETPHGLVDHSGQVWYVHVCRPGDV